ncbi:MAG: TonB family protein [Bacteroidales bacterium]|nr:TonB family protein [Bacteroidales bacterium]
MDQEKQSKLIGLCATILVHVLLAVILWLAYFGKPVNTEDESGILVMVGMDAEGNGNELKPSDATVLRPEPAPQDVEPAPAPQPTPPPAPSPKPAAEPLLAQDDASAPSIAAEKAEEHKKKQAEEARLKAEEQKRQEEIRRQQEEAAKRQAINNQMAGLFNNKGNGDNQGLQGSPDGNSQTGAVSGSPGYGEFDLGGRGLVGSLPRPSFNANLSGKVVVYITVDASGIVKSANIGRGTTISDQSLRNAAREAALKARFKSISGTSLTPGTITYYFDSNN